MAQIFPPSTNTISKVSIVGTATLLGAGALVLTTANRWPWIDNVEVAIEQPVPFSHKHHLQDLGIDCRYCHTSVEEAASAGIPPTKTCMSCHSVVWKDAPLLEPIRESYRTDASIEWTKVHDLPDFVYFNHSVHVKKGMACESCHGRVDQMPLMWKVNSLNMEWCLSCHRDPAAKIRPRDMVYTMGWDPEHPEKSGSNMAAMSQEELATKLMKEYDVHSLTNCSTCHR